MRTLTLLITLLFFSACTGTGYIYRHIPPMETLKLCFVGDTGTGKPAQRAVAESLEKEKCNSIHFLGDIIYDNGIKNASDPEFQTKFYDYYYPLTIKDFHPRLYIILGNHDHNGSVKAWTEIAKKHQNIIFPNPWYLVTINNLCLLHLDTDYYVKIWDLPTGMKQKSWVKSLEKDELKKCQKKVALTHHPYESRGKNHGKSSGWIRRFQEDVIIGKFDFLISGHEHILSDEGVKKGTRLLISGAGGGPPRGEAAGYVVMTWNKNRNELSYEFRKLTE